MNSKSACDSVQVQTVPGSSHHNVTQKYCYYSSFPCFTEAWGCVTAVYSTAKKHHLFDPAARYCFEAHTLKSTHLLNQIFLIKPWIHTLVFLVWWKPKGEGGMLLAPMLTLSDVSKGGWDTCAQGANTSCLQLPTYATKRNSSSGCYLYGSALLITWGCSHCSCSQRSDFGKLRLWERQLPTISQLSSE